MGSGIFCRDTGVGSSPYMRPVFATAEIAIPLIAQRRTELTNSSIAHGMTPPTG